MKLSAILKKAANFLLNQNTIQLKGSGKISNHVTLKGVNIRGNVAVGENTILKFVELSGNVTIGHHTTINGPNVQILSLVNPITVGNFCSIAKDVTIQEYNHKTDGLSSYNFNKHVFGGKAIDDVISKGAIRIGSDVWIGTKCVVLSGVSIGDGAIVAAGSIVTKDVPPFAIVGGNPARVIRYRFTPEVIAKLAAVKWWEWSMERIKRNQRFFTSPVDLNSLEKIVD